MAKLMTATLDLFRRSLSWSPLGLFRFSALTFNAHLIHYSQPWCNHVEKLPGLVVHGPLNLINILDVWRDSISMDSARYMPPRRIEYKAVAPLYAGQEYIISLKTVGKGRLIATVSRDVGGTVNMAATIAQ